MKLTITIHLLALVLVSCGGKDHHQQPAPTTRPPTTTVETTTTTLEAPTTTLEVTTTTVAMTTTTTIPHHGQWCGGPDFSPPCPGVPGFNPQEACVVGDHVCSAGVRYDCKLSCNFFMRALKSIFR